MTLMSLTSPVTTFSKKLIICLLNEQVNIYQTPDSMKASIHLSISVKKAAISKDYVANRNLNSFMCPCLADRHNKY